MPAATATPIRMMDVMAGEIPRLLFDAFFVIGSKDVAAVKRIRGLFLDTIFAAMNAASLGKIGAFAMLWYSVLFENLLVFFCCVVFLGALAWLGLDKKKSYHKLQGVISAARHAITDRATTRQVRISTSHNDRIVGLARPFLRYGPVEYVQNKIRVHTQRKVGISGKAYNPRIMAQRSVSYAILSSFPAFPLAAYLGLAVHPLLFSVFLAPIIWVFYPRIRISLDVSGRKAAMDDELAFFTLYASVMQTVGRPLYQSMVDMVGKKIFPALEGETKMLYRNVHLFGFDQLAALNEHALRHPNSDFRNLLLGYVSISTSGGDLGKYMEAKSQEFLHKVQFRHLTYRSQAQMIGESMLILLTILPTMILTASFLLADDAVATLVLLLFVVIPVVTILIISLTNLSQPKSNNVIRCDARCLLAGLLVLGVFLAIGQQAWLAIGMGVATGALLNFLSCFRQFREVSLLESAVPDFFRNVTEYQKIGIPIPSAIMRISESRHYNRDFDALLDAISARLRNGNDLSAILDSVLIRSWIANISFFVLGRISGSGGGTAQILEHLTGFSSNINQTKRDTHASVGVLSYFAMAGPPMMAYTSNEMIKIAHKLSLESGSALQRFFGASSAHVPDGLLETTNLIIIVSGISLGLVASKLTYSTLKHTMILGIFVVVSVLSILLSPLFPSLIGT